MHDVFISYSNKNKDVADSICHYLEDTGIRCWYAPRDLTPGSDWKEGIVNAITEAQIFILIYSEESNHSEQVKSELAVAEDCECKIFTFRISDEKMNPSFTYSLKKLHWIDAINTPLQNSIKELRDRVWMNLGRDESAALIEELPKTQTSQKSTKAQKAKASQTNTKAPQSDVKTQGTQKAAKESQKVKTKSTTVKSGKSSGSKKKFVLKRWQLGAIAVLAIVLLWAGISIFSGDSDSSAAGNSTVSNTKEAYVFGSEYKREEIKNIYFVNTLSEKNKSAWDVALGKDEVATAWVEETEGGYNLYIGAEGGVKLSSCYALFSEYTAVESIDFNNCVDTSMVENMAFMFNGCEMLTSLDLSCFDTSKVTAMNGMFQGCDNLVSVNVSSFKTDRVSDMSAMFNLCESLERLDLSNFNTSRVTDMKRMFQGCKLLEYLDISSFDTSHVISMSCMFVECVSLPYVDVSGFDTSKVIDMERMFQLCNRLEKLDVSGFDTSRVTSMHQMFRDCKMLLELDVSSFDTSCVMDMSAMFHGCVYLQEIDVSGFNTARVVDLSALFSLCKSLQKVDVSGFDTSMVRDMSLMFQGCESLLELDVTGFNTSNVTDMSNMFASCKNLSKLDLSKFDMSKVTETKNMLQGAGVTEEETGLKK